MRYLKLVFLCAVIAGCADATDLPTDATPQFSKKKVGTGEGDAGTMATMQDPCPMPGQSPECDGVFLTRGASDWGSCALAPGYDGDGDGVDDLCEFRVAEAFAPQLYVSQSEQARIRESYLCGKTGA